jgi:hypothetical protein
MRCDRWSGGDGRRFAAPVSNSNRVARCVLDRRRGCRRRGVECWGRTREGRSIRQLREIFGDDGGGASFVFAALAIAEHA